MSHTFGSILQRECTNSNQVLLYLQPDGTSWKAYEASARNLSELLGSPCLERETLEDLPLDTLRITGETFLAQSLDDYCSLISDEVVVLDLPAKRL